MFDAKDVDRILDGIAEASEETLARSRLGRTLAEASSPQGLLEVRRAWREVDAVMGPGKSAMDVMLARYPSLKEASDRMNKLLRRGRRARTANTRKIVLAKMDVELKAFGKLKAEIAGRAERSVDEIRDRLRAEFTDEFKGGRRTISKREARAECVEALDEFELGLQTQRAAVEHMLDAAPTAAQAEKRAEAMVGRMKGTADVGERAAINYRIKRFAQHSNAQELGIEFSKSLKRRLRRDFPALHDIEDSALVFLEALGAIESSSPRVARLLRRYAEGAPLTTTELSRVEGVLGQLRGMMPEEVATRMGFCDALFHKAAFEVLADIPANLRSQLSVELVDGPLWVVGSSGPLRQFGDGSMLITGPGGKSAIVGLGEVKAGFDEELLEQLFARSDRRAIDATVTFLDNEGNVQVRRLTREFDLEGADKPVAVTKPPIYVHSTPGGQGDDVAERFKEMVEDQMRSGRELLKVQLPFSTAENNRFAEEALREGVKVMKRIRPDWGR